jgi:hypothetical protein
MTQVAFVCLSSHVLFCVDTGDQLWSQIGQPLRWFVPVTRRALGGPPIRKHLHMEAQQLKQFATSCLCLPLSILGLSNITCSYDTSNGIFLASSHSMRNIALLSPFTVLFQLAHVEQIVEFPEKICASFGSARYTRPG